MQKSDSSLFRSLWGIAAAGLLASLGSAAAEELPKIPVLLLDQARQAAQAAVAQCEKDGYQVSAAVVDQGGVLKAQLRADGAGPHTIDSSRNKAYTAASLGEPTGEMAQLVAEHPELHALGDMNASILLLGGGLPVVFQDKLVGGIGVGGAPGAHLDEACARAGVKAIDAQMPQQTQD